MNIPSARHCANHLLAHRQALADADGRVRAA